MPAVTVVRACVAPGDGRGPRDGAVAGDGRVVLDAEQRVGGVEVVVVHRGGRGGAAGHRALTCSYKEIELSN